MNSFFKLNRLIVLFLGIGFLALAFEVYTMHYEQLSSKPQMWIPIVFGSFAGVVIVLSGIFFFNRLFFHFFRFLMILSCFVGLLGLYFHNKWRFPQIFDFLFLHKPLDFEIFITYTPVIAPSAFIAMGGLGLLISFFEGWGK